MIHSIRRFLFISLIIAITMASAITAIGNYLLDKHIVKPYLDNITSTKIVATEQYEMRNKLTNLIARNNIYITLITYPLFAIFIWLIIGMALRSITRITYQISNRVPTHLEPINSNQIPIEIKPLVDKLNQLLECLRQAFERNKRFAADTAHELRTPLAALKTQAQVALKAHDEAARQDVLLKVMQGADRCSHIVTQLLTLSSLSQEEALNDIHPVNLHALTAEILTYIVPLALDKKIDIELAPSPKNSKILGNDIALGILIRNLVDNAIRYTPPKGTVTVVISNTHHFVSLCITDTGPGIPIELRERVFDRFYRILGTTETGSGLGLAIVKQIAELHHAQISLSTPPSGVGLQVDILFTKLNTSTLNSRQPAHSLKNRKKRRKRRSK